MSSKSHNSVTSKVASDLNLSANSDDGIGNRSTDELGSSNDQNPSEVANWLNGSQPVATPQVNNQLTNSLMDLISLGLIKIVQSERGEAKLEIQPQHSVDSDSDNTNASGDVARSDGPVTPPNPRTTSTYHVPPEEFKRLAPAREANKWHSFVTERGTLAESTRIAQKLGAVNPFHPIDPAKSFDFTGWPCLDHDEIRSDLNQLAIDNSELLFQAMLFKNRSDLDALVRKRNLIKEPRFDLFLQASRDLGL